MTDLQAAVALPQLARLDEHQRGAGRTTPRGSPTGWPGVAGPVAAPVPAGREHVWHQYTVRVTARDAAHRARTSPTR